MAVGRWYPSVVTMSDGRQLITAGYDVNGANTNVVEVFDPKTNSISRLTPTKSLPLYPRTFQTSKPGEIFYAGPTAPGFWNPVTGAFKAVNKPVGAKGTGFGSCFFGDVRDQNLMIMGGGWPATASTNVIDLDSAAPAYRAGPAMTAAKGYVSCVNLPDGTVFEANGGSDNTIAAASSTTALLTSLTGPWQAMSPLPSGEHRLYHSLLFLQDDGRVVSVTSNPNGRRDRAEQVLPGVLAALPEQGHPADDHQCSDRGAVRRHVRDRDVGGDRPLGAAHHGHDRAVRDALHRPEPALPVAAPDRRSDHLPDLTGHHAAGVVPDLGRRQRQRAVGRQVGPPVLTGR